MIFLLIAGSYTPLCMVTLRDGVGPLMCIIVWSIAAVGILIKGAKYTRSRLPVTLVYYETYPTRQEAMRRDWEIKQLTREEKKRLIADFV